MPSRRMWAFDNALKNARGNAEELAVIARQHLMASLELEAKIEDMRRSQPAERAGHGLPPLTQMDYDLLSDVIWWLRGCPAGHPEWFSWPVR